MCKCKKKTFFIKISLQRLRYLKRNYRLSFSFMYVVFSLKRKKIDTTRRLFKKNWLSNPYSISVREILVPRDF